MNVDAIANILKVSDYFAFIYLSKNLLKDEGVNKIAKSLLSSMSVVHLDVTSKETHLKRRVCCLECWIDIIY